MIITRQSHAGVLIKKDDKASSVNSDRNKKTGNTDIFVELIARRDQKKVRSTEAERTMNLHDSLSSHHFDPSTAAGESRENRATT